MYLYRLNIRECFCSQGSSHTRVRPLLGATFGFFPPQLHRLILCAPLIFGYGVATISRLLKIIGLFCKRALRKRRYSAKETYNFKEPTNRRRAIPLSLQRHMHRYTQTYTDIHRHTQTYTDIQTLTPTNTGRTYTHSHIYTHACSHVTQQGWGDIHARTRTHARLTLDSSRTLRLAVCSRTHTYAHTHANTHTHMHTPCPSRECVCVDKITITSTVCQCM